jgi:predicted aspartyl protease
MKYSLFFLFPLLLLSILGLPTVAIAQINNGVTNAFTKRLETLLDQKEYFRLDKDLKFFKENLAEGEKLYYQCFVDNAFNRNEACITDIDKMFKITSLILPDSTKAALLLLESDSYFKLFQYARAAHIDSIVLSKYASWLENSVLSDTKNNFLISKALQDIPPQETNIYHGTTLKWKYDRMGLINIPVKINNQTINSVFDTKANFSCITQTYANKIGIKILDAFIEEGSAITGIRFKNGLGVADSLYIGDIVLKNVVFLVMPDEKLQFGSFSIHAIIGYPVIEQLIEIQFYKDGRMIVPANVSENNLHNLVLDGLNPVLSLKTGNDTLCFHLDLGAQQTRLYATYFERYKEAIIKEGKKTTTKIGGAGGSIRKDIYLIPELNFFVDNKDVRLRKVNIFTQKLSPQERLYGILGEDFIRNFDEFVLNFRYMFFKVK